MEIKKVKDYEAMSDEACSIFIEKIQANDNPVLGFATGSTPEGLYKRLIDKYKKGEISFKNAISFNLDEYVGLNRDNPNSYYFFMQDKLFNHINLPMENIHLPNGNAEDLAKECQEYEEKIKKAGHIDIQVLGIGVNGHIAFNEPGTPFTTRTHIIDLDESTREANSRFFDSIEEVPTQAITMGIETILESKKIILLASGENKADAVLKLHEGTISEDFPASALQKHPNVTVIADEAAMKKVK